MLPCAILCGGLATRLRPVTDKIPKSLIPIQGQPFLAYQLELLRRNEIRDVVLCVGFLGEQIEQFAGSGSAWGLNLTCSSDGGTPLGTAGAIRNAIGYLGERFFVLYGDSYLDCDYRSIAASFLHSGKRGMMTIYRNNGQFDRSNVEAEEGKILRYDKQNFSENMRYIDYGLGLFERSVFAGLARDRSTDLATVYQSLLAAGELTAHEVKQRFYEIGSREGIREFEQYLSQTSSVTAEQ